MTPLKPISRQRLINELDNHIAYIQEGMQRVGPNVVLTRGYAARICRNLWRAECELAQSQGGRARERRSVMPTASNLLCGCGRFMRPKQNSVTVEELDELQRPYKLWDADLWECEECGVEVIAGFGKGPITEHYQPDYAEQRERLQPIYPGRCREVVTREGA